MKQLFFFAFMLPIACMGQSVVYSIDMVAPDSFYLAETIYQAPTKESPRPAEYTQYKLFRSLGALTDFVQDGLKNAEKEAAEAEKLAKSAADTRKRALEIQALADKYKRS